MKYPCPHCSTVASRAGNLRTHVMGSTVRGGHALSRPQAEEMVARIESGISRSIPVATTPRSSSERFVSGSLLRAGHWRSPVLLPTTPTRAPAERDKGITVVASDALWQRELRDRQSRWRERKGHPIGHHDGRQVGSLLAMPAAEEGLWNFLTPAVGQLVRDEYLANRVRPRSVQKLYGHPRLFDNLLSSQPLVFNLFGELALNLDRATRAARLLWPERVASVTRVEFELSPGRGDALYLGNRTAADVAIFHTTRRGGTGLVFVETKYTKT